MTEETREAIFGSFPGSIEERRELLAAALLRVSPDTQYESMFLFDDHAVVMAGGNYYKYPYTISEEGQLELGAAEEVMPQFAAKPRGRGRPRKPVTATGPGATVYNFEDEDMIVLEAEEGGWVFEIVLVKSGVSKNGFEYPEDALRKAIPLYEGAQVYADHPTPNELQQRRGNRSVRDLVGWIEGVRFISSRLVGKFHIVESQENAWLRDLMKAAVQENKSLVGFSHNIGYESDKVEERVVGGRRVRTLREIHSVNSVDVVTRPSAGGEVLRLVAHQEDSDMVKTLKDLEAVKPDIYKTLCTLRESNWDAYSALATQWVEEIGDKPEVPQAQETVVTEAKVVDDSAVQAIREQVEALKRVNCQTLLESKLASLDKLPAILKEDLRERFQDRAFEIAELDQAVDKAKKLHAAMEQNQSGAVRIPAGSSRVGSSRLDMLAAFDGMLAGKDVNIYQATDGKEGSKDDPSVKRFRSIREAYCNWTGTDSLDADGMTMFYRLREKKVTLGSSYASSIHENVIMEDLDTSTWGEIMADRMHKKMMRDYIAMNENATWRRIVSEVGSVSDFRTHRQQRLGGYGTVASVSENQQYPDLTTPGDEEVTYSLSKYGGLDRITLESIANDDLNAIRRLPGRMARAVSETLHREVFAHLTDNTTLYDTVALFHATHANIVTSNPALSHAALSTARAQFRDQTAYGDTTVYLGLSPKILLIPSELEDTAYRILNSGVYGAGGTVSGENATTANMHQNRLEYIIIDHWTDANDWYLVADPSTIDTIGVYFLNGREEPELFVQDDPTVGDNLNYDRITYKVRHFWETMPLDFRGMMKSGVS